MSTELLLKIGTALYGDAFRGSLAADLGVSDRTLRSWLSGQRDVPGGVWDDLAALIEMQQARLRAAMFQLNHDIRLATVNPDDDKPF